MPANSTKLVEDPLKWVHVRILQRINHLISLISALLVLFLADSAFFLSFESLKDLAVQIGVAREIAFI